MWRHSLTPLEEQIIDAKKNLWQLTTKDWLYDDLNSWGWWLSFVVTFAPWIIWWKLADKKRIAEILLFGLLINTIASFLDVMGSEAVLWDYPDKLLPNTPRLLPIDLTILPVSFMFLYQYFTSWKSFGIAVTIMSAVYSFIAEPLLVRLDLYFLVHWKYIYSFPIYIAMAFFCRWLTKLLIKIQKGHS